MRLLVAAVLVFASLSGDVRAVRDDVIEDKASRKIRRSTILRKLPLTIAVREGVVTLSGEVDDLDQRATVRRKISKIHGVLKLHEEIELRSAGRDDAEIVTELDKRFRKKRRLRKRQFEIDVTGGVVTITGTVGWGKDRTRAIEEARRVPGVVEIVDDIGTKTVEDEKIYKLLRRLFADVPRVPIGGRILPTVVDGHVTLEGLVPKLYHVDLAEQTTWEVIGVRGVDNRLVVAP